MASRAKRLSGNIDLRIGDIRSAAEEEVRHRLLAKPRPLPEQFDAVRVFALHFVRGGEAENLCGKQQFRADVDRLAGGIAFHIESVENLRTIGQRHAHGAIRCAGCEGVFALRDDLDVPAPDDLARTRLARRHRDADARDDVGHGARLRGHHRQAGFQVFAFDRETGRSQREQNHGNKGVSVHAEYVPLGVAVSM